MAMNAAMWLSPLPRELVLWMSFRYSMSSQIPVGASVSIFRPSVSVFLRQIAHGWDAGPADVF